MLSRLNKSTAAQKTISQVFLYVGRINCDGYFQFFVIKLKPLTSESICFICFINTGYRQILFYSVQVAQVALIVVFNIWKIYGYLMRKILLNKQIMEIL